MKTYKTIIPAFKVVRDPKASSFPKCKISSSGDAAGYARLFYSDDIEVYESFFLIMLNQANNTTGYVKISQGGAAGTVVDIKIIAKYAVECLAQAVILVHNHPSGTLKPSEADKEITRKAKAGLKMLDITVLDHIILVPEYGKYYSFADSGIIS